MKNVVLIITIAFSACIVVTGQAEPAGSPPLSAQQERAREILRQMLPPEVAAGIASSPTASYFGSELARLSYENVFVQLWARPGLSLRERSLVTISMLIALGAEEELAVHFAAGLRNGLTAEELEEVVYQATAYAGFPRAARARAIAAEVVAKENKQAAYE